MKFDDKDLRKKEEKPLRGGRLHTPDEFRERLKGKRFLFTVAQNNTKLHEKFWATLTRMAKKRKAKLCIAKLSYNKNGWQKITTESEGLWYDERIEPFVITEQVKVADDLVFCGDLDLLPTMQFPLTGLDNYTGINSAIVPHTKMQMQSLATMKDADAKMLYTTGAVTLRNYIQRRAGQIAEFHHVFGAVWVEIDDKGKWFVRQLNADENGIIYDLDRVWGPTYDVPATEFGRPFINLGDIHIEKSDDDQMTGALSMLTELNPEKVFIHDLLDMRSRNHHNLKDNHFLVQHLNHSVEADVTKAALWLQTMAQAYPETTFYVIRSNHDEALGRWVKNGSGFPDPVNLRYWHELNAAMLRFAERGESLDVFQYALYLTAPELPTLRNVRFVQEDESVVYLGIEFGMHGHLGPNGARGNPRNFRQLGRRANTGHTHSAGIIDGIYTAGVLGSLDMGYNKGPSSWSCSHIITYPNAKRTIVTQRGNRWKA
ncbi:DNA transfer protein [Agrobacterium phage Atu_ph02]|uniref:Putative A1 protein n=1 Tax=Agrobacterium phage Atu_ph02 TaxID=2024261 RepID=A0A223VZT4_9CAUD|nr:DNA transfer protein [Agrobacterium phage Atu_ph02]ASV44559.1 putative A1 protein [Agrobacterium phage Atu_ph02]